MSKNKTTRLVPIIIAVSIVAGIMIGTHYASYFTPKQDQAKYLKTAFNKINALFHIISEQYVDSVDINDLMEKTLPQVLGELDPHSTYIPAKEMEAMSSELEGSFSGIGIQFSIQSDTIYVSSVIPGGPSEKVGLMAGDRIVSVDDTLFVGKEVTVYSAPRKLKGPKGTQVKLGVMRQAEPEMLYFTVVRGDIPVHSVDASYMINNHLGYIKISKFGRTTYIEMLTAIAKLRQQNCDGLIIDLRGNTGGYMEAAIQMVTEFLPQGELIVYTEGRAFPREERYSSGRGSCQQIPLVVLTDESSASASEIFAGAIQDNDRGMIIGRRSFGKGLVQQPCDFKDGSTVRLTIARYYTPSGRSIQKPYERGHDSDYEMDILKRYEHGEFFSEDSIKQDESLKYYTRIGRVVYGGGGIMPDIFVPQDTLSMTSYYNIAVNRGLTIQYAFNYTDKNRATLQEYKDWRSLLAHLKQQGIVEQFVRFADGKGVKRRNLMIQKSYHLFEKSLYGNIIYNMLGLESHVEFFNQTDVTMQKAIEVLEKGEAFPKAPEAKAEEATQSAMPENSTAINGVPNRPQENRYSSPEAQLYAHA